MEKDFLNSENWKTCSNGKLKVYRMRVHKSNTQIRSQLRAAQRGDIGAVKLLADIEHSTDKNYNYGHGWAIKKSPDPYTTYSQYGTDQSTIYSNFCTLDGDIDVDKKMLLSIDNIQSNNRFKIVSDISNPDTKRMPNSKFDYTYTLQFNESSGEYTISSHHRVEFTDTSDNKFLAENVQICKKYMIVTREEPTTLNDFVVYVRGIEKNKFLYSKPLSSLIDDYDNVVNFMPDEGTLADDQSYGQHSFDVQVNTYGETILLRVGRVRYTDDSNNTTLQYSRHYLMTWDDCKNKFVSLDFLNSEKTHRINKDIPNYDNSPYYRLERAYNANASHVHEESHYATFQYILTPTDDILIFSQYNIEYHTDIQTYNGSCNTNWTIGHRKDTSNFHKYVYNAESKTLEKTAEKTALLPFPEMNTSGGFGGATFKKWGSWPGTYWNTGFHYLNKPKNPLYYFGQKVNAEICEATVIHFDPEYLILELTIQKPWLKTEHGISDCETSFNEGKATQISELRKKYLVKYKLNETNVFEITSVSDPEQYQYVSNMNEYSTAKFKSKDTLILRTHSSSAPTILSNFYNNNRNQLLFKDRPILDLISSWYYMVGYSLQYNMDIDPPPSGVNDQLLGFRQVDMSGSEMTFTELTSLTELVNSIVGENEVLISYECDQGNILLSIMRLISNEGNVIVDNSRIVVVQSDDQFTYSVKQVINYLDIYPTERNASGKLYSGDYFEVDSVLRQINNTLCKNFNDIKEGIILT